MDEITAEAAEDMPEILKIMIRQPITHSYQLEEAEVTKVGAAVIMIERLELIAEEVDGEEDIEVVDEEELAIPILMGVDPLQWKITLMIQTLHPELMVR